MPPGHAANKKLALSDDEASDVEMHPVGTYSKNALSDDDEVMSGVEPSLDNKAGRKSQDKEDVDNDEDDDDDDEDLDEDEFIVEAIKKHMIDEDGTLKFLVKWEGYEKKSDMTWEPEENLEESASEVLANYLEKIGGRDMIFEESEKAARGKKRGRPSVGGTPASAKRSRKNGTHPADTTPPVSSKKWNPPAGSWEDDIDAIEACEDGGSGKLVIFLLWKNGRKTKHDTSVVYKKCPQKMLQFYERHVKIIRDEKAAEE